MLRALLNKAAACGWIKDARAHCDVPCGIYDTGPALVAAVSVVRLMDILNESAGDNDIALANQRSRVIAEKEKQAELVKHEIRIIWGDYFKPAVAEKYPEIHSLVHRIMLKGSACKQDVHREDALALVDLVNQFAEIFWNSKGVASARGICPYPPQIEVVYPVLSK